MTMTKETTLATRKTQILASIKVLPVVLGRIRKNRTLEGCRRKQILGVVVKVPEGLETMVAADLGPRRL
jgi:hypothetical protein